MNQKLPHRRGRKGRRGTQGRDFPKSRPVKTLEPAFCAWFPSF